MVKNAVIFHRFCHVNAVVSPARVQQDDSAAILEPGVNLAARNLVTTFVLARNNLGTTSWDENRDIQKTTPEFHQIIYFFHVANTIILGKWAQFIYH